MASSSTSTLASTPRLMYALSMQLDFGSFGHRQFLCLHLQALCKPKDFQVGIALGRCHIDATLSYGICYCDPYSYH